MFEFLEILRILPGNLARAHPCPQDTIPCWTASAPVPVKSGPPESPWQESIPPVVRKNMIWCFWKIFLEVYEFLRRWRKKINTVGGVTGAHHGRIDGWFSGSAWIKKKKNVINLLTQTIRFSLFWFANLHIYYRNQHRKPREYQHCEGRQKCFRRTATLSKERKC